MWFFLPKTRLRKALASACAARHGHGYRHASGPFRLSESQLWRVLSLDDLSRFQHLLPAVTLVSELCLKDPSECMSLATAAAGLASETVDHHIYYALFTFDTDAAAKLFSGVEDEHDNNHWCSAKPCVDIVFDEHHMNVQIEAQCFEVGMPAIHVGSVDCDSLQDDAVGICCTSPMQPDLRLHASCCSVEDDHELNDLSQLRSAVRSSHPLPLLLGVYSQDTLPETFKP